MARPRSSPPAFQSPLASELAQAAIDFEKQSGIPQVSATWGHFATALGHQLPASITAAKESTRRMQRRR